MEFVSGNHTLRSIAEFLKSEDVEIALAVAFWGSAAMERLAVAEWKAKTVRVICNATSGACNPKALTALRSHFKSNLRTNPNLHSKVYWTPAKLVVTSANASASGLSLQNEEVEGNIEAGIAATSQRLLSEARAWFDRICDSPETTEVDEKAIKQAKRLWFQQRPPRISLKEVHTVTDALRERAALKDRDIWVINYEGEDRSKEGEKQNKALKQKWAAGRLKAPIVAGGEVSFDGVDDYEETSLLGYHWKSWVIDLETREPFFWYVPDKRDVVTNTKTKTVPVYRARKILFGDRWIAVSRSDIEELRKRWKGKLGHQSDTWVPLAELAD